MSAPEHASSEQRHGDVFDRGSGSMFIHVQRENGLAHRTMVLRPWQVQALRLLVSRWFAVILTVAVASWAYSSIQAARVPFLTTRLAHLERDAAKIDTLQATLDQVQKRYDQVQQMLSASTRPAAPVAVPKTTGSAQKPGAPAKPGTATPKPSATSPNASRAPAR